MARDVVQTITNTKYGKIQRMENKMFGGFEYQVFKPNGDCVKRTPMLNEAMRTLEIWKVAMKALKKGE